jgi:hypothetical protein
MEPIDKSQNTNQQTLIEKPNPDKFHNNQQIENNTDSQNVNQPNRRLSTAKFLFDPFSLFKNKFFVTLLIISIFLLVVGLFQKDESLRVMLQVPLVVIVPITSGVIIIRSLYKK